MSVPYSSVVSAMRRAITEIVDARASLDLVEPPELLTDAQALERVGRRLENAGAQLELDARMVVGVAQRQGPEL